MKGTFLGNYIKYNFLSLGIFKGFNCIYLEFFPWWEENFRKEEVRIQWGSNCVPSHTKPWGTHGDSTYNINPPWFTGSGWFQQIHTYYRWKSQGTGSQRIPGHQETNLCAQHRACSKWWSHNLNPGRLSVGGGFLVPTLQMPKHDQSIPCCTMQQPTGRGEAYNPIWKTLQDMPSYKTCQVKRKKGGGGGDRKEIAELYIQSNTKFK